MQHLESQDQAEGFQPNLEISKRAVSSLANKLYSEFEKSKITNDSRELKKRYFIILARQVLIVDKLQRMYIDGLTKHPKEAIASLHTILTIPDRIKLWKLKS